MDTYQARIDQLRQKLSGSGHRITPQRLCILQALIGANQHPSAEEIYAQVQQTCPTTSLATVYKTLDTLRDMGEVMEMEVGDGRHHFDEVRPDFHPHVVCTRCAAIEDVEMEGLTSILAQAGQASGYADSNPAR